MLCLCDHSVGAAGLATCMHVHIDIPHRYPHWLWWMLVVGSGAVGDQVCRALTRVVTANM